MECCSPVKHTFVVFLLLFSTVEMNGAEDCNATFTAVSGTFHSPNYPYNYNNSLDCYYMIQMPPGYRITLTFQSFETEGGFDFVKMFDGGSSSVRLLGSYNGTSKPQVTRSTQNKLLVHFHTDGSVTTSGFHCSYSIEYVLSIPFVDGCLDETFHLSTSFPHFSKITDQIVLTYAVSSAFFVHFNVQEVLKGCATLHGLSGTFISPNYPSNYSNNQDSCYLILIPPEFHVTLTFQHFRLHYSDYVQMFDGDSRDAPSLGRYTGSNMPPDKRTTQHKMLILFHSDSSYSEFGFNCSYHAACDRNFTALTGNLRSPNFPSGYMNNQDCSFLITLPPDYSISLTFQHFNLEPNSSSGCLDYVEIFDGGSSGAPSLGRLCGPKEPTEDKHTTQNEMLVHYHTDSSLALSGFDASYHSVCDSVLTTLTGSFHSPGFPSTYENSLDCDFLISVPRGYRISLTFVHFNLEAGSSVSGCHDFVEVYDGSSRRAPLLGRYCGTEAPSDDMRTTQQEMLVRFHTDNTNTSAGFNASYISDCHMTFTAPSGSFYYPHYPPNYGNDQVCDYLISVAPGNQISVKFHHIGQESSGTIDDDCSSHVEIFDGNSTMAPSLGRFCGTGQPEVNHTTGNQMLVRFHSDGSVPSPRFYSTYSSVNASLTLPPDSSANSASDVSQNVVIVGGSVGGFALVLAVALIILVVLFVKRTDRKEAEPLALSDIHARPTSNAYLSDTKRETEQEEEDIYENTTVEINDENPEGVYSEPAPSCPPQTKTTGQRRVRDNRGGAAQISKPAQEDVLPSQAAVQEPQFPCEGDYEGLCRTQADADVNDYVMPPQPASREPAKYPEEDLYMNM